jgi:hypothetical protein
MQRDMTVLTKNISTASPTVRSRRRWIVAALCVTLVAAACWAIAQVRAQAEEDKVRATAREYYAATAAGDVSRCLAATHLPMTVISNGVATSRSEAQLRTLLARVAAQTGATPLTAEERARVEQRVQGMFNEAEITFTGADTAIALFPLPTVGSKQQNGDLIGLLILHRLGSDWRVIAEVSDSAPVPRSYLKEEPPPPADSPQPAGTR